MTEGLGPEDPWGAGPLVEPWPAAWPVLLADARLGPFAARTGPPRIPAPEPGPGGAFRALARSIVFQQLSGRAAAVIWTRVEAAAGAPLHPSAPLLRDEPRLREAGLSRAKVVALQGLARAVTAADLDLQALKTAPDEEVLSRLVALQGVGPWTARMFLVFQLHRPDVWPVGDLAVRAGWARLHDLAPVPKARALVAAADHLRPWRSAVAWICWRVMDGGTA